MLRQASAAPPRSRRPTGPRGGARRSQSGDTAHNPDARREVGVGEWNDAAVGRIRRLVRRLEDTREALDRGAAVRQPVGTAGVDAVNVYHDLASGVRDDRPGLDSCLRALRKDDVLVVWKLDRLGRNLAHLVNTVQDLAARAVGLRVLAGQGTQVDTTSAGGRLVFGIFAALAEFERELIRERTVAGLEAARARGRKGGRKFALSKAQVRLAQSAMAHRDTSVSELCRELGIRPVTLYRYVGPQGQLREQGRKVLGAEPEDRVAGSGLA